MIDGKTYNTKQIDIIASKVLKNCNFNKNKNKNNNTIHKCGDGKLMITNGLSVVEFEKKFKL